jgi:hypothetical protein
VVVVVVITTTQQSALAVLVVVEMLALSVSRLQVVLDLQTQVQVVAQGLEMTEQMLLTEVQVVQEL